MCRSGLNERRAWPTRTVRQGAGWGNVVGLRLKCNPAAGLPLPGAHLVEVADAHGLGEHLFELRGVAGVGSPGEIVVVILTGGPASIADDVRRVVLVAAQ